MHARAGARQGVRLSGRAASLQSEWLPGAAAAVGKAWGGALAWMPGSMRSTSASCSITPNTFRSAPCLSASRVTAKASAPSSRAGVSGGGGRGWGCQRRADWWSGQREAHPLTLAVKDRASALRITTKRGVQGARWAPATRLNSCWGVGVEGSYAVKFQRPHRAGGGQAGSQPQSMQHAAAVLGIQA